MSEEVEVDIKGEIIKLQSKLSDIKQRISELQLQCQHQDTGITLCIDGIGRREGIRIICNDCRRVLGYPTEEDLKKAGYEIN